MYYDDPLLPDILVADILRPTGLLDRDGNPIHKAHPPIGFGRDNEWRSAKYITTKRI